MKMARVNGGWKFSLKIRPGATKTKPNGVCSIVHAILYCSHLLSSSIRSEHPTEDVIQRGRILGGLEPSRAFGDARYKWTLGVQEMWVP